MPKGISPVSPASPRSLRLRAELPKVMRLSPKAMTILGGVSCLAISAALWWGLRATRPEATQNLYETANPNRLERITGGPVRSEEHTSELQSLIRTSYAGFC